MLDSTNLKIIDAKLEKVHAYKMRNELGIIGWYLQLVYEYEDADGLHMVTFPKVSLPFSQTSIPNFDCTKNFEQPYSDPQMYISTPSKVPALKSYVLDPLTGKAIYGTQMADIIIKPEIHKTRKMTVKEIEKNLGYKIEIVNNAKGE